MYRQADDHRNRTHWTFNEHGNVRPWGRNRRAIALVAVVTLAAIALVLLDRVGG